MKRHWAKIHFFIPEAPSDFNEKVWPRGVQYKIKKSGVKACLQINTVSSLVVFKKHRVKPGGQPIIG
jgi:hypothetical protein